MKSKGKISAVVCISAVYISLVFCCEALVSVEMKYIGDPGNAPDFAPDGVPVNTYQYGRVDYGYSIGTYEVSVAQYTEFLNNVALADPHGLYNAAMGVPTTLGGAFIARSGLSGSYVYSAVAGTENQPVRGVDLWDCARFCNWMHNGQGGGGTEAGSYTLAGNDIWVSRSDTATYVIPTADEWYKAAYYDETTGCYHTYPTGSDSVPSSGEANYNNGSLQYTSAGDTTGASSYGVHDMAGNAAEWTESYAGNSWYREIRGGDLVSSEMFINKTTGYIAQNPAVDFGTNGFRVAYVDMVPEPASCLLLGLGIYGVCYTRRRLRNGYGMHYWISFLTTRNIVMRRERRVRRIRKSCCASI